MRLEQGDHIQQLLEYYMGKNTMERQEFIINNLKVELDKAEELSEVLATNYTNSHEGCRLTNCVIRGQLNEKKDQSIFVQVVGRGELFKTAQQGFLFFI